MHQEHTQRDTVVVLPSSERNIDPLYQQLTLCLSFPLQMVYGKPPFHNIKNTVHKMQAITNNTVAIEFPEIGASGPVEKELLEVLKKTLERWGWL